MKILNAQQIKVADRYTIEHEPISSLMLMERAGDRLFERILERFPHFHSFMVFCGPGNNGGDGLVIARLMFQANKVVQIVLLSGNYSVECLQNIERIKELAIPLIIIEKKEQVKEIVFNEEICFIDALYGIGVNRPIEGLGAELIRTINATNNFKIAIDIPSGLSPDGLHNSLIENTVKADYTLTIQLPKFSFLFPENNELTGTFECVDIGLSKAFSAQQKGYIFLDENEIRNIIIPRPENGHKGTFGHALIIAGSAGKIGASILSAKAALRTGCGLLTAMIPEEAVIPLLSHLAEAMVLSPPEINDLDFDKYEAIGFGPGIGTSEPAISILNALLLNYKGKLVIDADGLNILAKHKDWFRLLDSNVVLTPHPGEFDRITHQHSSGLERFKTQLNLSVKYKVTIVLKGHYSSITTADGNAYFNSTGNSGMATAGSGDVLTGIITSLCAQGYEPGKAARLGVYLHGFAGDFEAAKNSKTSLVASDIINGITAFFKIFEK